jgi:AcrR family transcriptional regulator
VTAAARKPRYERQVASDRREALVDAAIESLKRFGHDGLSVRRIAAEAGVSIGLINHHFPNKDTLVAESYRTFSRRLAETFEAAVVAAGGDPHARLRAYFSAFFSRPNLDPQVLTAWIVYWSLVQVSPEMRAVHAEEGRGYGELLGRLLSDLARARRVQTDIKQAVVGLTCLLDGLWLKWCLDPESYRPKDAVALCEDWVERVIEPQPKGPTTR